jgi:hypothetical protein
MELAAIKSVVSTEVADILGFLLPPGALCFHRLGGFPPVPAPASESKSGSSSQLLGLSFRVRSCLSPAECPKPSAPPSGSLSPSRHKMVKSTYCRASQTRLSFRPQRFSRSRRFTPSPSVWACFIPLPRPGFALQGFSPLPSRPASSTGRALLSLARLSSRQVASPVPDPLASPSGP